MRNQSKLDFLKWRKIGRCYRPPGGSYYEMFQRQFMRDFFEVYTPKQIMKNYSTADARFILGMYIKSHIEHPSEHFTIYKWIDPE